VRALVTERIGAAPTGPIRVLAQLRTLGHCFNPVSFYYCFDEQESLQALVAEVTSTPWGERHCYVLGRTGDGPVLTGGFAKQLHVSPFMGMDQKYWWRASPPGPTLSVQIATDERGERAFEATLSLKRLPLTKPVVRRITARYPAASIRVLTLIYSHALMLGLKGVPVHPRPQVQP
jgi:hypothetical protein